MARLIVKSPYLKGGGNIGGYVQYIATRDRVELLPDDRPPTRKQEQLIQKLSKDFPETLELEEYRDYKAVPTKAAASAVISTALEVNWPQVSRQDGYAQYIATRPRAEKLGKHGLFGDEDAVDLTQAMTELEQYPGNVWAHILSLKREDAERLGYDNARAWRNLLRTHRNEIAEAMHIPAENFRWYAAFHNEGHHPHVHMMAWSAKPGEAYLSKEGIREIKSTLTNDIFREELLHVYQQKSQSRDQLVQEARQTMKQLTQSLLEELGSHTAAEAKLLELSQTLTEVSGKKTYGYLPKSVKRQVDALVDQLEQIPQIHRSYEAWWKVACQVEDFYAERDRKRPKLSEQKEFRSIKNAVIQEASHLRELTFEDRGFRKKDEPFDGYGVTWACWNLWEDIRDEELPLEQRDRAIEKLETLGRNGDADAQYLVGKLYRDGGLVLPDSQQARDWFLQSAESGNHMAQYALGKLCLTDDLQVRNVEQAEYWLNRAAEQQNPWAEYALAKEYLTGTTLEKNPEKAASLLLDAGEAGNCYAEYLLGKLYLSGQVLPMDREAAETWLGRASYDGHPWAAFLLDRVQDPQPHAVELALTMVKLVAQICRTFEDHTQPVTPPRPRMDRKAWEKRMRRKLALGQRLDDHEDSKMDEVNQRL